MPKRHRILRFETRQQPLLTQQAYYWRIARNFLSASVLIFVSLFAGMCGYRYIEKMDWIDAFVNAAMILSGMGPVTPMNTYNGKLFAGCYALYSGLTLVLATGLIFAPVIHRLLHHFHIDDEK